MQVSGDQVTVGSTLAATASRVSAAQSEHQAALEAQARRLDEHAAHLEHAAAAQDAAQDAMRRVVMEGVQGLLARGFAALTETMGGSVAALAAENLELKQQNGRLHAEVRAGGRDQRGKRVCLRGARLRGALRKRAHIRTALFIERTHLYIYISIFNYVCPFNIPFS